MRPPAGQDPGDRRDRPAHSHASMLSSLLGDDLSAPVSAGGGRRGSDRDLAFVGSAISQLVAEVVDYAILILDAGGHVVSWNRGAERIKGYRAEEIVGQHFSVFYPSDDVAAGRCSDLLRTAELEGRVEHEGWRVRRDGSQFWANVVITVLRDADEALIGFGKVTRDLTERRRHEQHLEHLATHDALSDLANRRAFTVALHRHLAAHGDDTRSDGGEEHHESAGRNATSDRAAAGTLLLIDLDRFKLVNDTLGHAEGDILIRATADILNRCLDRVPGLPARIGGDEFAVLAPSTNQAEARALALAIIKAVSEWSRERFGPDGPDVSASVGCCPLVGGVESVDAAMARADRALYEAKRAGRGRVATADPPATEHA